MTDYTLLTEQLKSLSEDEPYYIPVLSNASALIMDGVNGLNWAGFYLISFASLRASYISKTMPMISSFGMDISIFFTVTFDMLFLFVLTLLAFPIICIL